MRSESETAGHEYVSSWRFSDYEQMDAVIRHADIKTTLLGRAQGEWHVLHARLRLGSIQAASEGAATATVGSITPGLCGFVASFHQTGPILFNGHPISGRQLVFYRGGAEMSGSSMGPCRWASFGIPPEELNRVLAALGGGQAPPLPASGSIFVPEPQSADALCDLLKRAAELSSTDPGALESEQVRTDIEQNLLLAFARALISADYREAPASRAWASRHRTIAAAEAYMRANIDKPIYLASLCEATGVSERSLHDAFVQTYELSPMRYLKVQRLNQVRRALRAATPRQDSVMSIARRFGIWEMGRFAGEYYALFGEYPSQTLNGGPGRQPATPADRPRA